MIQNFLLTSKLVEPYRGQVAAPQLNDSVPVFTRYLIDSLAVFTRYLTDSLAVFSRYLTDLPVFSRIPLWERVLLYELIVVGVVGGIASAISSVQSIIDEGLERSCLIG